MSKEKEPDALQSLHVNMSNDLKRLDNIRKMIAIAEAVEDANLLERSYFIIKELTPSSKTPEAHKWLEEVERIFKDQPFTKENNNGTN